MLTIKIIAMRRGGRKQIRRFDKGNYLFECLMKRKALSGKEIVDLSSNIMGYCFS